MSQQLSSRRSRYRSVFLSDVHLGSRDCRAEYLLEFLRSVDADTLYLVGDIVDLWSLNKSFFWPQVHNDVLRTILGKARDGTRVIYIPGNHDMLFRDYVGMAFGNVEIRRDAIHQTADGRRFLVMHGDEFDAVIRASPLIETLGNGAYALVLGLNRLVNSVRHRLGFPYWSMADYLKQKVGKAATYIANFERALAGEARRRGLDGTICGHIHRAGIAPIDGVTYCNDGDWVESCTTLTEDFNGRLAIWRWSDHQASNIARNDASGAAVRPIDQAA